MKRRSASKQTYVEPEVSWSAADEFLVNHLSSMNLLRQGEAYAGAIDGEYPTSHAFWHDVISENLNALRRVRLLNFQVSSWYPRSPGIYHTDFAAFNRKEAEGYVTERDGVHFYLPQGKGNMIQGGLGTVRFQNSRIDGEECWLCTATDDGYCHSGVPLIIPDKLARTIRLDSSDRFTIDGELYFLPPFLRKTFGHLTSIPQLHVRPHKFERVEKMLEILFEARPFVHNQHYCCLLFFPFHLVTALTASVAVLSSLALGWVGWRRHKLVYLLLALVIGVGGLAWPPWAYLFLLGPVSTVIALRRRKAPWLGNCFQSAQTGWKDTYFSSRIPVRSSALLRGFVLKCCKNVTFLAKTGEGDKSSISIPLRAAVKRTVVGTGTTNSAQQLHLGYYGAALNIDIRETARADELGVTVDVHTVDLINYVHKARDAQEVPWESVALDHVAAITAANYVAHSDIGRRPPEVTLKLRLTTSKRHTNSHPQVGKGLETALC